MGLAFLLEYFDRTFKVPEDIRERLSVPLLGAVRDLKPKDLVDLQELAVTPKPPTHYQMIKSSVALIVGVPIERSAPMSRS